MRREGTMPDLDSAAIQARLDAIAPWPWKLRNDNDAWGQRPLWVVEGGHDDPDGQTSPSRLS